MIFYLRMIQCILKHHRDIVRDFFLKNVYKWMTGKSRSVVKTPFKTASGFLFESYSLFPNLYKDDNPNLITSKT